MKRIFIIIILLSLIPITEVSARIGFNAGYKHFYYMDSHGGIRKPLEGFYIGAEYDIRLFRLLSIAPGVNYSFGSRSDGNISIGSYLAEKSTQEHLIEAPLRLKLTIPVSKNFGFIVYGGVSFSYAMSGEISYEFNRISEEEKRLSYKYDYYKNKMSVENIDQALMTAIGLQTDNNEYKNYDLMLGWGLGFMLGKKLVIHGGQDQGMINNFAEKKSGTQLRNSFHIGATYIF